MSEPERLRILSLGAGVQSSTLALMMAKGEIEPADHAIFADTGNEPKKVYQWLEWLTKQLPFPVHIVSKGNLKDAVMADSKKEDRYMLPLHLAGGGYRASTVHVALQIDSDTSQNTRIERR